MAAIFIGGCGPHVTTRLVTVELVKPPEVAIQRVKTIGVLPFDSPDQVVGRELANKLVKGLNHEPFVARMIKEPEVFKVEADALRALGQKALVDGLLLGEITQYSVKSSRDLTRMLALPEFGSGNPAEYSWVGIRENPLIADTFYYRIRPLRGPTIVKVPIITVSCSLSAHLRLIEAQSGSTLWEEEITRNFERYSLPGSSVEKEADVDRLQASMVEEVVTRLKSQAAAVQRMLRAPPLAMDLGAAKLVRQGIQTAGQEDWLGAEKLFLEAMKEAPDECSINGNLGIAYEKNGRLFEAMAAYERAYRCQPRDPTYRYYGDDLQTAFAPDLDKEDLPTLVLDVREDGMIYLDGGESQRQHPGQKFILYRTEVLHNQKTSRIETYREIDLAEGNIVEVRQQISLGQLLLYDPKRKIRRGDIVRIIDK
jgi:tetratricopeptide (TPR) repeat protein